MSPGEGKKGPAHTQTAWLYSAATPRAGTSTASALAASAPEGWTSTILTPHLQLTWWLRARSKHDMKHRVALPDLLLLLHHNSQMSDLQCSSYEQTHRLFPSLSPRPYAHTDGGDAMVGDVLQGSPVRPCHVLVAALPFEHIHLEHPLTHGTPGPQRCS